MRPGDPARAFAELREEIHAATLAGLRALGLEEPLERAADRIDRAIDDALARIWARRERRRYALWGHRWWQESPTAWSDLASVKIGPRWSPTEQLGHRARRSFISDRKRLYIARGPRP
jgi:hypothetical protein